MSELAAIGLQSLYHLMTNEVHGTESIPTFFLRRNASKKYHIDYAFVSEDLMDKCDLEIGAATGLLKISYHMPLMLVVDIQ